VQIPSPELAYLSDMLEEINSVFSIWAELIEVKIK